MQNPRLASRYAKSLLDLAVEHNTLDAAFSDMQTLNSVCRQSRDFRLMLESPVIKGDKKLSVLDAVLKGYNVNKLTMAFISLLVSKRREDSLPEIAEAFVAQYNALKHIKTVKLTTAAPMTDAVKKSIESKIAGNMPGDTLNLETTIDESLIGGFVLELGDQLFDASVKKKLADMKTSLVDRSYESKMA